MIPVTAETRNYARALLAMLGKNPSPSGISALTQQTELTKIGVIFTADGKDYQVLKMPDLYAFFEYGLLKNPKSLPARFLAVFLQGLVLSDRTKVLPFERYLELADLFKRDDCAESNFLLHQLIVECPDISGKIEEILAFDFESVEQGIAEIASVFGFYALPQDFNGEKFWILEHKRRPKYEEIAQGLLEQARINESVCIKPEDKDCNLC